MLIAPPDATPESWHRFFAATTNNAAWPLTESDDPSTRAALLDAAHASAWHWKQAGTELHRMRATMLLALAHAVVGHGDTAIRYADEMRTFFLAKTDAPDWELAYTHTVHAQAAAVAGLAGAHAASYAAAQAALAAIANPEDRAIVEATFSRVPRPAGA